MARFRAFLTDSESEAEENNQNSLIVTHPLPQPGDDSDGTGSGSESESGPPPKHLKLAPVRRKDENNYRGSKTRRSESSTDRSTSGEEDSEDDEILPPNQPQVDTSLIPRAQQLGVDPQRMHVMQASLFRTEDGVEGVSARNHPSLSLSRKHSRDSDGEGLRQDSQQVSVCPGSPINLTLWPISAHLSLTT
jgi:nuclear pore complex protein Nup98-Nup96